MSATRPDEDRAQDSDARHSSEGKPRGRLRRRLEDVASRYALLRMALGTHIVYREAGGGLIASGLSYAALFALIPTLALVAAGVVLLVDDPTVRADALEMVSSAVPALESVAAPAIDGAIESAAVGSVIALIGFAWAASGLYLNLTRAMERFFPGERVSGALARVAGVVLVVLVIFGVLAAVVVAGALSVVARAIGIDVEWLLASVNAVLTLALASGITYGIYRVMPSSPPTAASARVPALLVGVSIGLMTLLYGLLSPWLISGYQVFGVMASVFVALVWLRVLFMAMTYGAALARYRDGKASTGRPGAAELDPAPTAPSRDTGQGSAGRG